MGHVQMAKSCSWPESHIKNVSQCHTAARKLRGRTLLNPLCRHVRHIASRSVTQVHAVRTWLNSHDDSQRVECDEDSVCPKRRCGHFVRGLHHVGSHQLVVQPALRALRHGHRLSDRLNLNRDDHSQIDT
jgi:hypothetical protein